MISSSSFLLLHFLSDRKYFGIAKKITKIMSDSEDTDASCAEWPVTKEWLESLLTVHHGEASGIFIEDFDVSPGCTAGESVLSDILAVTVDYTTKPDETKRELNVIVKLLPQDAFSRFFVTEAQFDLREIKFYTQVRHQKYYQSLKIRIQYHCRKLLFKHQTSKHSFNLYKSLSFL